jgi:diacylglycerol kinase (ATP)
MRIHYAIALLVLILGFVVRLTKLELAVLFFTVSLVIAMELVNTAIEATIDLITDKYHPLAKIAKNVAAGAVLISSINAVAVGYVLFFDKFDRFTFTIINSIQEVPLYLYNSLVGVLLLLIIVFKTVMSDLKKTQGLPSGQTTVAFAFVMAVLFLSENLFLTMCSIAIALMVAQNRMNNNRHSLIEVILGAVLGILFGIIGFVVLL